MTLPDTHAAGTIVGQLLRILHGMGLISGAAAIALALLALAPSWGIYKSRTVVAPMILLIVMIAGTCYSQFIVIPSMERDRIAAGGDVNAADAANPARIHFNHLHVLSEGLEQAILLVGLATVVLVARAGALHDNEVPALLISPFREPRNEFLLSIAPRRERAAGRCAHAAGTRP